MEARYSNSWGILPLCRVNLKQHKKSESTGGWTACFEPSCHHVFVWHWCSHTKKKPSASQQRRFELHTCLRSYSQLTLTQPRRRKKGKSSSHPARQKGRQADRQEGSLFWNVAYLLYLAFFFLPYFSLLYIFSPHLHFFPLCLCRVPPPLPVASVSLCVCLASHSCHSRAPQGLLSRRG